MSRVGPEATFTLESGLHLGDQNVLVILSCHLSLPYKTDHVVRKVLDDVDHG